MSPLTLSLTSYRGFIQASDDLGEASEPVAALRARAARRAPVKSYNTTIDLGSADEGEDSFQIADEDDDDEESFAESDSE